MEAISGWLRHDEASSVSDWLFLYFYPKPNQSNQRRQRVLAKLRYSRAGHDFSLLGLPWLSSENLTIV